MRLTLPLAVFRDTLAEQARFFDRRLESGVIAETVNAALERYEFCAKHIALPGYRENGDVLLNHLHGDQSAILLYFCANTAWRGGHAELAQAFFLLNKMRNGLVCMYDTELPDIFLLNHTVGTVLGKAMYGPFFVAYHGVTVGTEAGKQPLLGSGVILYPGASIVGATQLGDRVVVSSKTLVRNAHIPNDTVVAGVPAQTHARKHDALGRYFQL